jgi:alginate O-acetyltransferase complex protein AlgI
MLFNSLEFVLFFIIVTSIFFLLPHKFRWLHLLLASCYFYMAFVPVYILILAGTIVIDYFAGILIENATPANKRFFLLLSLVANIGVLAVFKYYNFFIENINLASDSLQLPYLKILLPIGLSFHTFQAMSYTLEVYKGNQKAERHFGIYALYVMFYPQLVAGPIERPQNILHQFYEKKTFNPDDFFIGFKMMLWGMFKKVVIADRLAIFVNQLYDNPHGFSGSEHFIAAVFFAVQIYCDFSGYSSIAIGAARTMGFKLMTNFKTPYESVTVSEFWNRWHISLSSWFKDYLFYPIAVARRNWGIGAVVFATLITFLISGFWHGAGWNFIFWGFLTGLFIVAETLLNVKSFKIRKSPVKKTLGIIYVFAVFAFTEIFFRAKNIKEGFYVVKRIFTSKWTVPQGTAIFSNFSLLLSVALIVFLFVAEASFIDDLVESRLQERKKNNLAFGIAILSMIILLGVFQKLSFIYFQF